MEVFRHLQANIGRKQFRISGAGLRKGWGGGDNSSKSFGMMWFCDDLQALHLYYKPSMHCSRRSQPHLLLESWLRCPVLHRPTCMRLTSPLGFSVKAQAGATSLLMYAQPGNEMEWAPTESHLWLTGGGGQILSRPRHSSLFLPVDGQCWDIFQQLSRLSPW